VIKRLPPLNPLRAFEATARQGSLTLAAEELRVTHGAISHQIRALEGTLKVKLFRREGRQLRLTTNGAELLPAVSSAFDGIAAATVRLTRPATSGELSVSCVPAVLSLWLIPRLGGFTARYPGVRLRLSGSNDRSDLRSPDVDICFHYNDGNWSECWYKKWSDVVLFPVMSPKLSNERPIGTVRDLARQERGAAGPPVLAEAGQDADKIDLSAPIRLAC
jgi:LysR family glycine cleavage system transcriptional activator